MEAQPGRLTPETVALPHHTKWLQPAHRKMVVAPLPTQTENAICQHAGSDLGFAGAVLSCQLREAKPAVSAFTQGSLSDDTAHTVKSVWPLQAVLYGIQQIVGSFCES